MSGAETSLSGGDRFRNMNARIYTADTEDFRDPELYSRIFEELPEIRKKKVLKLKREEDRLCSLAAGALLLRLARDKGLPEDMADLTENEYGKPFFSEHPDVQFSLSHSGTRVLLAVSDRPVGCDVERIRKDWNYMGIARRFYAPEELALLTAEADPDARAILFYRLWTLKESFLKETGRGLYLPLDSFCIRFSGNETAVISSETIPDTISTEVCLYSWGPEGGYLYACCVAEDRRVSPFF